MGKTYRRQTGDKFERRQRKRQNKNPKKDDTKYFHLEEKEPYVDEKTYKQNIHRAYCTYNV